MPRTLRPATKLVKIREACETLAICRDTFWVRWHGVFTDPRPKELRKPRFERKVFEDELSVALEQGSAAVKIFRRTMGRL